MVASQTGDNRKNGPAANSVPKRRRSDHLVRDRSSLLIAKLLSTLLGALAGFIIAYILSLVYAKPLQDKLVDANANLTRAKQSQEAIEPEYVRARDARNRLQDRVNELTGKTAQSVPLSGDEQPDAAHGPGAAGSAGAPGNKAEMQVPESLRQQLDKAQKEYNAAQAEKTLIDRDIKFWEDRRVEIQNYLSAWELVSAAIVLILALIGYALYPLMLGNVIRTGTFWGMYLTGPESRAQQALIGLVAGVVLAIVVLMAIFNMFVAEGTPLSNPLFRILFGAFVVVALGVTGTLVGVTYFGPQQAEADPYSEFRTQSPPHLLDSSVIIDGRVHEVAASGFITGALVVCNSVLRELQNMADSGDERKRSRGRRGLELVRKIQDDPRLDLRVFDDTSFDAQAHGTDEHLIIAAQAMNGVVVTNDYNLNRVAAIRNVRVININALANAVKTNHLPGDMIEIQIIDKGKQRGQGIGYLEDGTMVVIEDGEPYLKQNKVIRLTSVTQTVQGRLIFGRVDAAEEEGQQNGR